MLALRDREIPFKNTLCDAVFFKDDLIVATLAIARGVESRAMATAELCPRGHERIWIIFIHVQCVKI